MQRTHNEQPEEPGNTENNEGHRRTLANQCRLLQLGVSQRNATATVHTVRVANLTGLTGLTGV